MRICVYTHTALPVMGGQQLVVDALAREFHRTGNEVVVLSPYTEASKFAISYDRELPYRVVRHPNFISTRFFVNWYARYLEQLYRAWPFDILHSHNVYPCGYLAGPFCQRHAIPFVITSHGGDVRRDNPRYRKRGLRERHVSAIRDAQTLISISEFTTDGFLDLGADSRRIHAIPNGVDFQSLSTFVKRPEEIDPRIQSKNYFLYIGRLAPRKGIDVLVRATALLKQRDSRPLIVIAGTGPEEDSLRSLTKELGVTDQVMFAGSLYGQHKTWILQNARAAILPSREWEAFPLVVLEANAARCPVIGSDIPGLRELIQHERSGLLVPEENPAALAQSLDRLMDQVELAPRFQAAASQFAESCSWPNIAKRHLELFSDLIDKNCQRRAA